MKSSMVATNMELERNRGYWRAKGFNRNASEPCLTRGDEMIKRDRGRWCLYDVARGRVKAEPILYTLLKTII
ncbi:MULTISPECIES: creatininase [Enterobacteriaceae]|uniref:creatininase n=1 Tax=Enterobacteriaceae TaxID=543 RepID=UPI0025A2AB42|nr:MULTISPECIES: creatininase [Enterobacteriaceae]EAT3775090.1 creatininase [Salmonella enterica]MCE1279297.1 creatininase [Enterobacter hormaechei]EJF0838590.1 creatininase [Salmonella enterica]MCE1315783.1 creatininase [Enterobacter hormaechei]MDM7040847.1 creatininase [Klebsiella pneumoniae]